MFGRFGGIKNIKLIKNRIRDKKNNLNKDEKQKVGVGKNTEEMIGPEFWKAIVNFTTNQGFENTIKQTLKTFPIKLYNRQTLPMKDFNGNYKAESWCELL